MTSSLKRVSSAVAAVVLALGLVGCGDDSGSDASDASGGSGGSVASGGSDGSPGSSSGSPDEAYVAFVEAVRDGDADAFDAAVHDGYWSDVTEELDDNAANLAAHHWAIENEVMSLPDEPDEVRVGDEALGAEGGGSADSYAEQIGELLGVDGLTGDDLAVIMVADAFDVGLTNRANEANCAEADKPIDECLDDTEPTDREDLDVILVRGDDGWQVFGTEPAH